MVNKQDIFNELAKIQIEQKENEMILICDGICPELLRKLEENELAAIYPIRALLIYNIDRQQQHEQ